MLTHTLFLIQKDNTYKDRWCLLQFAIFPKLYFAEKYLCTSPWDLTTICNKENQVTIATEGLTVKNSISSIRIESKY
jgi:hypothetical protein